MKNILSYCLTLTFLLLSSSSFASNTAGVHGPGVKDGAKSMQLRFALASADSSGQVDNWAYRLHYQQGFSDKILGRITLQYRDRGSFQYEYARGEVLYRFKNKASDGAWSSGMRFDLRQRRGDNPQDFAVHWTNQWDLSNEYKLRGVLIGAKQFGGKNAAPGVRVEMRGSINKALDTGISIGIESFNTLGKLGDFGSFNSQSHQIGPVISGKFSGFDVHARYLAGVSNGTRDHNFGLWIGASF